MANGNPKGSRSGADDSECDSLSGEREVGRQGSYVVRRIEKEPETPLPPSLPEQRENAERWLFILITLSVAALIIFDLVLVPIFAPPTGTVTAVNVGLGGGSGILAVCATFVLHAYKTAFSPVDKGPPHRRRQSQ